MPESVSTPPEPVDTVPNLTKAQRRVMGWLGKGWEGYPGGGAAVMINGKRICNVDTLSALRRLGLVDEDEHHCWKATDAGRAVTNALEL